MKEFRGLRRLVSNGSASVDMNRPSFPRESQNSTAGNECPPCR
jgi:hypothetical protein